MREGSRSEGDGKNGRKNAPPSPGQPDAIHELLADCGMIMKWESDLRARQVWAGGTPAQLMQAAEECSVAASNQVGGIDNPYVYWRRWLERCAREANAGGQAVGGTNIDRILGKSLAETMMGSG